jgi:hypothetical protein
MKLLQNREFCISRLYAITCKGLNRMNAEQMAYHGQGQQGQLPEQLAMQPEINGQPNPEYVKCHTYSNCTIQWKFKQIVTKSFFDFLRMLSMILRHQNRYEKFQQEYENAKASMDDDGNPLNWMTEDDFREYQFDESLKF